MTAMASTINELLDTLEAEDYTAAIRYIEFLAASRKRERNRESRQTLNEIQQMLSDDKGWESEEEMLADMAEFRKERLKL